MSKMGLLNKCRCCQNEGNCEPLEVKDSIFNINYSTMIEDTFNIKIFKHSQDDSTICEKCKFSLKDAYLFKKQVLLSEENFMLYNKNGFQYDTVDMEKKIKEERSDEHSKISEGYETIYLSEVDIDKDHNVENENIIKSEGDLFTVNKDKQNEEDMKQVEIKTENDISDSATIVEKDRELDDKVESLKNVVKTQSGSVYPCNDKSFNTRKSILTHIPKYQIGPQKLVKSNHKFTDVIELRRHHRGHSKTKPRNIHDVVCKKPRLRQDIPVIGFKCDICPKEFKYKSSLKNHIFTHIGGKTKHLCETCGMSFNDITNLKIHERAVHLKLRPFTCDHCQATYSAKKHLKYHIITKHLGLKEYRCNFCGISFATNSDKARHDDKHGISFQCCQMTFDNKSEYLSHVKRYKCTRSDSGVRKKKPRSCDECGKIFASTFSWTRHVLQKHNGARQRDITCDICNQKFYETSSMNRHKFKTHVPDIIRDKSKCNICNRSYRNLQKHLRSHVNTPHFCDLCGKSFPEVSSRNRHMKYVHSSAEERFSCRICGKEYKGKGALKRHREKSHSAKTDFDDYVSRFIISKGGS